MKVLVTGAAGFVGCNVLPAIANAGHEVYATDLVQSRVFEELGLEKVELSLGTDVLSPRGMARVTKGMDAVVHLAALPGILQAHEDPESAFTVNAGGTLKVLQAVHLAALPGILQAHEDPESAFTVNAGGTLKVLQACKAQDNPPRVILASTGSAATPNNPYAASKAAAEALVLAWGAAYGLDVVVLRFTNLYGPWSAHKANAIPTWIRKIQRGEAIQVNGDGTQEVDFLNTADMARAVVAALVAPEAVGQIVTVGSGKKTSLLEVLGILRQLEPDFDLEFVDDRPVPRPAVNPEAAVAARDVLGWSPRVTLQDGISELWDWFTIRQDLVEEPGSTGVGRFELINVTGLPDDVWRIDFRDALGKKRRKEIDLSTIQAHRASLDRTKKRAPESEQYNVQLAIEEADWLISLIGAEQPALAE